MTHELTTFLTNLAHGILLLTAWRLGRRERHFQYLEAVAGNRNLWKVRCNVCRKPLRDSPSATHTTPGPVEGSTVSVSYHADSPCQTIFNKRTTKPGPTPEGPAGPSARPLPPAA
ncbi:hypothetical protein ACIQU4_15450 [Streptomyces sp. NPDC090741]|uniref:hypothetical protein n=1 Tax=Streptomyces sp. NPDC090741 TaxID=3365967 RepID=UPI00380E08E9